MTSLTAHIDDNIRRRQEDDPLLQNFRDISATDKEYEELIHHIKAKTSLKEIKKLPQTSATFKYLSIWNRVEILDKSAGTLITMDRYSIIISQDARRYWIFYTSLIKDR